MIGSGEVACAHFLFREVMIRIYDHTCCSRIHSPRRYSNVYTDVNY